MFAWLKRLLGKPHCGNCGHFRAQYNKISKSGAWLPVYSRCCRLDRFVDKNDFKCNGAFYIKNKHSAYYYQQRMKDYYEDWHED